MCGRSSYNKAVDICQSDLTMEEQSQQLKQLAHDQFQHRHSTWRLLADSLIVIGFLFAGLGLVVGLSRVAMGNPFFFSNEMTNREKDFQHLLNSMQV